MLFVVDGKLRTFFGWSPGLRLTLSGHVLPCGCLVGSYETWEGDIIRVIDAHDDRCHEATHVNNAIVKHAHADALQIRLQHF